MAQQQYDPYSEDPYAAKPRPVGDPLADPSTPDAGGVGMNGQPNAQPQPLGDTSAPQASTVASPSDWIGDALKSVNSTDDPNYWRNVIAQHGDTNNAGAQGYWLDRIRRGDGSSLVANGTLQRFQDGGGASGSGGSAFQDQVRALLMKTIGDSQQPVDVNSAEIKQPFDAATLDAQRQLQAGQKANAEAAYAQGRGSSSNELDQQNAQAREGVAGSLSTLKGQLVQRAVQTKVAQLQQALSLAVQSGDAESARQIQMQIASMNNMLGQQQLAQQGSQWNDQYGLNLQNAIYQRNRDAYNATLGA